MQFAGAMIGGIGGDTYGRTKVARLLGTDVDDLDDDDDEDLEDFDDAA